MSVIRVVVASILAVISSSHAFCDFPQGATPFVANSVCAPLADDRIQCEASIYQAVTRCFWNNADGFCTSVAVATGEDTICPWITSPTKCAQTRFLHNRACVWYEVPTDRPSQVPSVAPSNDPTMSPSDLPTHRPSLAPTPLPTPLPTPRPTRSPTPLPTRRPIEEPTLRATRWPTVPPTSMPTVAPSSAPTLTPSQSPSNNPSSSPTRLPSASPSKHPTPYPTRFPTRAPTTKPTRQPSFEPSNAPTTNPSKSPSISPSSAPSSLPTKTTAVEELVHVCRCNKLKRCFDKPLARGEELSICGWVQAPVVMEMVKFLQLSQYPVQQTVVQDDSGKDGGSLFWSGDMSSFVVRVVIDDDFFKRPTGMVAIGRIGYSLSQRRRMDESIFVVNNEEFTFRLEIPLAEPDSSGGVVSATSPDKEKKGSKGTMNLQIWIPAGVAGFAAIALLCFMFTVVNSRRNNGRSRKGKQKVQWQQASEQVPVEVT